jgi:nicotinamidase/pyrazinamidase
MEALIIVDIQNDFLPGGALEVKDGDQVIPYINEIQSIYDLVVATQDWHPADHKSFASNYPNGAPGEIIDLNGLQQILWPTHCVQNSFGAQFAEGLIQDNIKKVFVKGTDSEIDSYSGLFDNGHRKATGLAEYLKIKGVDKVVVVGLAADYCVKFTALDAAQYGFEVEVHKAGTMAVNLQEGDFEKAMMEMETAGITVV